MKLKIVLAGALLLLPVAAAQPFATTPAVEGHTVFVHVSPEGSDLAAIAGSVECEVKWFNDQVLFRVPIGTNGMCGDGRFVYAYATNAPDPRGNPTLAPTGRVWDFVDPNGAPWHVLEFTYQAVQLLVRQDLAIPGAPEELSLEQLNFSTWVVEAGAPTRDPTIHEDYNFVLLVDTTRVLLTEPGTTYHEGTPGNREAGNSHDNTEPGRYAPPHAHDKSWVSLGLGQEPAGWS